MVFHRIYAFNQSDYYEKLEKLHNEGWFVTKVFFPEKIFDNYEIIYRPRMTSDP
jgi:hypothetical protein